MGKRIYVFLLLLFILFLPLRVEAAKKNKHEYSLDCWYQTDNTEIQVVIDLTLGNMDTSKMKEKDYKNFYVVSTYIHKQNGEIVNIRKDAVKNWEPNLWLDVHHKKTCPKYLAFYKYGKGKKQFHVQMFYQKQTMESKYYKKYDNTEFYCMDKEHTDCTPYTFLEYLDYSEQSSTSQSCYYDKYGEKLSDGTDAAFTIIKMGDAVRGNSNKVTGAGVINKDDFYKDNTFTCVERLYYCVQDSHAPNQGMDMDKTVYYYFSNKSDYQKKLDNGCKKIASIEDEQTKRGETGVQQDEWLPTPTEVPTKEECEANPNKAGCVKNRCEVINTSGDVFKIIKQILGYIQVGSIFAVLIFCVLDLGGAVASSDDEAFRKARNKVFKRIIALILIFLVPLLVNFIINLVNLGACKEEDYDFIGNLFD